MPVSKPLLARPRSWIAATVFPKMPLYAEDGIVMKPSSVYRIKVLFILREVAGKPAVRLVQRPVADRAHRGRPFVQPFPQVITDRRHRSRICRAPVDALVVAAAEKHFPFHPAAADWAGPAGCSRETAVRIGAGSGVAVPAAVMPPC